MRSRMEGRFAGSGIVHDDYGDESFSRTKISKRKKGCRLHHEKEYQWKLLSSPVTTTYISQNVT